MATVVTTVETPPATASFEGSGSKAPEGAWGFPTITPEQAGFDRERLERIDRWIQGYVESGRIAAMSLAIVRDGHLVYGRCSGEISGSVATSSVSTNETPSRDVSPTTLHRIFSMTKPITGVAVLILFEQGHFLLDDPVARFLPEFAAPSVLEPDGSLVPARTPMTIRHLLTHTAGLSYGFLAGGPVDRALVDRGLDAVPGSVRPGSLAEWSRELASLPLAYHPGSRWHYSVAMDVLGRLVEVVAGQPFDDFVRARILEPLAMVDTDFSVPRDQIHRLATCYRKTEDGVVPIERRHSPFQQPPAVPLGGGGLVSTAADYLRFTEMLRRGGALNGVRLLAPATVDLMATDHLHGIVDAEFRDAPVTSLPSMSAFRGEGFGLTVMVSVDPARSGILGPPGQFAWGGAASTSFWIDRTSGLSVIQMAQLLPSSTYPLRAQSRNLVYQALVDP